MLISESLHPLLSGFTLDISQGMWWLTVEDYAASGPSGSLIALAAELDALSECAEKDSSLADALIEVGCYYWPGHDAGHRGWLRAVATRLREKAAIKFSR
jgi:hypothetical protein